MSDTINKIYNEINEKLTTEHLKKITVDIINLYKNKNYKRLKKYASFLDINSEINNAKLFSLLIKHYHPDKILFIFKQVEEIYRNNDYNKLKQFHESYFFNIDSINSAQEIDFEFETEYKFDHDDFGYKEKDIFEDDTFGETNLEFEEEAGSFMNAINNLFFGGLDYTITEFDLKNIDGALDLSDYDINDISGIEHCIYLNELNLSNNNIEKIGKLSTLQYVKSLYIANNLIENIAAFKNLIHLKEIDISFNNITDISVLVNLPELEYVNILGNPIKDYTDINKIVKKGVIVIYEHANLLF